MSRTRRRDSFDNYSVPKTLVQTIIDEDEDVDPRSYNNFERSKLEADTHPQWERDYRRR